MNLIYLASPYSHDNPQIEEYRFNDVCLVCARLFKEGRVPFSPIVHWHPVRKLCKLKGDAATWQKVNDVFLRRCDEVWILKLDGWERSKGVLYERQQAEELGKPVRYITL